MPKSAAEQFQDIQNLLSSKLDVSFYIAVEKYLYDEFFVPRTEKATGSMIGITADERSRFDAMLVKAIKKLQAEQMHGPMPGESRSKRAIRFVGKLIADLSTLGLWRLFKTPSARSQFEELAKYSKNIMDRELKTVSKKSFPRVAGPSKEEVTNLVAVQKHVRYGRIEKAKRHGEAQFLKYKTLVAAQISDGTYDSQDAKTARDNKMLEIKPFLENVEDNGVVRRTFGASLAKLNEGIAAIYEQIGRFEEAMPKVISDTDVDKKYDALVELTGSLEAKMAELRRHVNEDMNNLSGKINAALERDEGAVEVLRLVNEHNKESNRIKTSLRQEIASISREIESSREQIEKDLTSIQKQKSDLGAYLRNMPDTKDELDIALRAEAGRKLDAIVELVDSKQAAWGRREHGLIGRIDGQKTNLDELNGRINVDEIYVRGYKKHIVELSKGDKGPGLRNLDAALRAKLSEEIEVYKGMFGSGLFSSSDQQRADIIDAVAKKSIEIIGKNPFITATYLKKHQEHIVRSLVTRVKGKASINLRAVHKLPFDEEASSEAKIVIKEITDGIKEGLKFKSKATGEKEPELRLKAALVKELKEKIKPVRSLMGAYTDERDAVVDAFAEKYIQKLKDSASLKEAEAAAKSVFTEDNLKEIQDFVQDNWELLVNDTKEKVNRGLSVDKMVSDTVAKLRAEAREAAKPGPHAAREKAKRGRSRKR